MLMIERGETKMIRDSICELKEATSKLRFSATTRFLMTFRESMLERKLIPSVFVSAALMGDFNLSVFDVEYDDNLKLIDEFAIALADMVQEFVVVYQDFPQEFLIKQLNNLKVKV